jgi:hypothetical protein
MREALLNLVADTDEKGTRGQYGADMRRDMRTYR